MKLRIAGIVILFLIIVFFSKYDDYKDSKTFYDQDVSGVVMRVEEGRGTTLYIDQRLYLILGYKGPEIIKGDVIKKRGSQVLIYRDSNILPLEGFVAKPADSYFSYFFF
jgi:hypothetical protein